MGNLNRRSLLRSSLGTAGMIALAPYARVLGANDDVRVAVVGFNGMGKSHISAYRRIPGVRIVALCDVDTPRKYNRMVQGDFDQRSKESMHEAVRWIEAGNLGEIRLARGRCYKNRPSLGRVNGPGPIPKTVDYDLWIGPAPLLPLRRKRLHYDWHWVWATGCGELGNNGPHQLDVCRWVLGHDDLPSRVLSVGGRFGYDDDGETANTQFIYYDYKPAPIIYEVRGLPPKRGDSGRTMDLFEPVCRGGIRLRSSYNGTGPNTGVIIECEHGYVDMGGPTAYDYQGNVVKQFTGENIGPQANFIKAVRSRKRSDLRNDILDGHLSTVLSHMGNISHRIGRQMSPADILDRIKGNRDLVEVYDRFKAHLAANEVDLERTPATLGPVLTMDSQIECFTGDFSTEANMLLSRNYRNPFVVPEIV